LQNDGNLITIKNMNTEDINEDKQAIKRIHDKFFWDIYGRPSNVTGFLNNFYLQTS